MRALITGGAGFIGSHLADELLRRGHQVAILDDLSTGRHGNLEHLLGRRDFEFILGSVLSADLVDQAVSRCDAVFHLAAAVGVQLIVEQPVESLRTNVLGSELVIEKAHRYGRRLLVTSTSEIYGKNSSDALREGDDRILGSPLKSRWSYSEAKAIEEVFAYTYRKQKGLRAVIARLFNVVGPRQTGSYGMVVPRLVNQALRGEALTVFGDGEQTRCFCHVSDIVGPLIDLITCQAAYGQAINLGGNEEISIAQLAQRIIELTEARSKIRYVPYEEAYEEGFEDMPRRVPDTTLAAHMIGFAPQYDLDAMLLSVIAEQRG